MQVFPSHIRQLWNKWELRVLVLLSLTLQVFLIIFGRRRKYLRSSIISALVWITYLSADWIATVSLGTLANNQGDTDTEDKDHVLQALWAPFLLLHLGGPDTITAYSLEDNSLWLRHLLGLIVQIAVAFYIYLRSWSSSALTFIAIPIFISGIIKYAERTWVLRSASPEQFEDSLLSATMIQAPDLERIYADPELEYVHRGYSLFSMLKRLYANLSLRFAEGQRSYSLIVKEKEREENNYIKQESFFAFKLAEAQLGFLYDVLYTKATMIHSLHGLIFRVVSVLSAVSALVTCVVFIETHEYSRVDIDITYALLIGAIALELYAFVSLVLSDWTVHWLTKNKDSKKNCIAWALFRFQKRWSGCLAQQNLFSFCMKRRVIRCIGSDMFFRIYFAMELYWQRKWKDTADSGLNLKELIFGQLLEKHKRYEDSGFDYDVLKLLLSYRGNDVLKNNGFLKEVGWSIEVEFDHSVLIWHVATDICYHSAPDYEDEKVKELKKASKTLSDYMLYVLLMRPFMLPKWIDRITHVRDTFREATRILQRKQVSVEDDANAYASKILIQMHTQSHIPLQQRSKESSGKSVLQDGCRLASELQKLGCSWEMICQVWIEMMTYAASQCDWKAHAQQLRRGGEFLTHVCLVMADLGLNEQFGLGRKGFATENQNQGWGWAIGKIVDPNY